MNPRTCSLWSHCSTGFIVALGAVLCGCGDDASAIAETDSSTGADVAPATTDDTGQAADTEDAPDTEGEASAVSDYFDALPTWAEFSPPIDPRPPEVNSEAEVTRRVEVVEDVKLIDDAGGTIDLSEVTYDCTSTAYSMATNPSKVVIADPSQDVLYPGAFIQGRTHRDAINIGAVLPLTVNERAPIRVSIPAISSATDANFREVRPNQAEVTAAIGNMVGSATLEDLVTPSSISFEMKTYHSEQQFALEAGLSGRYLGFEGAASGAFETNASTTSVAVQFTQRMFTVAVEPPGSDAASFFTEDFTVENLAALEEAGRIGPDNLPVYVSQVVYGRMMTFTMTSTASETEILAALQASYDAIGTDVSVSLSEKDRSILENSSVVFTTLGGDQTNALAVISTGDWAQYFTEGAALSSASPLSYTFKNLGDNSIASVGEATEFEIESCQAREATPGLFQLRDAQDFALGMGGAIAEVIAADDDGDGYDDLIFNHREGANEVIALHSGGSGIFTLGSLHAFDGALPASSWNNYAVAAGDVDGDGDDDLVWNYNGAPCPASGECSGNTYYVGLAHGGTNGNVDRMEFKGAVNDSQPRNRAESCPFYLVDLNADGMAEPLVSCDDVPGYPGQSVTRSTMSMGEGDIRIVGWYDAFPVEGSVTIGEFVEDFDGDTIPDVLRYRDWQSQVNDIWSLHLASGNQDLLSKGTGHDLQGVFVDDGWTMLNGASWHNYTLLAGDVDGDAASDLIWVWTNVASLEPGQSETAATVVRVFAGLANDGIITPPIHQAYRVDELAVLDPQNPPLDPEYRLVDIGGTDGADLIINHREGSINHTYVGLSRDDGTFDYAAVPTEVPGNELWSQYTLVTGNFGGSAKQDLAWVKTTDNTRVYVAIAKD